MERWVNTPTPGSAARRSRGSNCFGEGFVYGQSLQTAEMCTGMLSSLRSDPQVQAIRCTRRPAAPAAAASATARASNNQAGWRNRFSSRTLRLRRSLRLHRRKRRPRELPELLPLSKQHHRIEAGFDDRQAGKIGIVPGGDACGVESHH